MKAQQTRSETSGTGEGEEGPWCLPCGHVVFRKDQVHYCTYIHLKELEAVYGRPIEREPIHPDERFFVYVHQVCELKFMQMLVDIDRAIHAIEESDYASAQLLLDRLTLLCRNVVDTILELKTMPKEVFLDILRPHLAPASGAESINYRRLEIRSGTALDDPFYTDHHGTIYRYREYLARMPAEGPRDPKTCWWLDEFDTLSALPSLRTAFEGMLLRHGCSYEQLKGQISEINDLTSIGRKLFMYDKAFERLRGAHLGVAVHFLGSLPGTGHTPGAPYLKSVLETHHLFPKLREVFV